MRLLSCTLRRPRRVWPPYCEVDYWTGASLVNLGRFQEAINILKDNLECKYSRLKSFEVLNLLFQGRIKDSPDDTAVSAEWFVLQKKKKKTDDQLKG